MGTIFHRAIKYRVLRQNARSGKIEKYDGGNASADAGGASEISNFRQHPQQTITLAISDDLYQCVHIFSKEPSCNKRH